MCINAIGISVDHIYITVRHLGRNLLWNVLIREIKVTKWCCGIDQTFFYIVLLCFVYSWHAYPFQQSIQVGSSGQAIATMCDLIPCHPSDVCKSFIIVSYCDQQNQTGNSMEIIDRVLRITDRSAIQSLAIGQTVIYLDNYLKMETDMNVKIISILGFIYI